MSPKLLLVLLLLSALYLSGDCWWGKRSKRRHTTTGTGRVLCKMENGFTRPLQHVVVKLKDKDLVFHDTFGSTRSSSNGRFSITGSARDLWGKPDPFIQVVYDYRGSYGRMEIDKIFGITRKHNFPKRKYSRHINFGNLVISDDHCRAYVHFFDGLKDYKRRTGQNLPFPVLRIRTQVLIHGKTPYALGTKIKIPKGYRLSPTTAQHEIAHTVRHKLDGSHAHFLWDAVRFWYARNHRCYTRSNYGFAFNEGFALFWAGQCFAASYGSSPMDYKIEGNVAIALRKLKNSCGLTDAKIINILRRNRRKIHSFADFKKKSGCP